jgi:hypothetical protein
MTTLSGDVDTVLRSPVIIGSRLIGGTVGV